MVDRNEKIISKQQSTKTHDLSPFDFLYLPQFLKPIIYLLLRIVSIQKGISHRQNASLSLFLRTEILLYLAQFSRRLFLHDLLFLSLFLFLRAQVRFGAVMKGLLLWLSRFFFVVCWVRRQKVYSWVVLKKRKVHSCVSHWVLIWYWRQEILRYTNDLETSKHVVKFWPSFLRNYALAQLKWR